MVVQGIVQPDGTLELAGKLALPAGGVQVTVVPLPDDPFWQRMQALWAGQKARGHVPRSVDEIEAERRATREEWEERMRRIEQIQAEAESVRRTGRPLP